MVSLTSLIGTYTKDKYSMKLRFDSVGTLIFIIYRTYNLGPFSYNREIKTVPITDLAVLNKCVNPKSVDDLQLNFVEYAQFVQKCFSENDTGSFKLNLINCCMGLSGESGELTDAVKKMIFHGKQTNISTLVSEAGDQLFYLTAFILLLEVPLSDIIKANKAKLITRYPNGRKNENIVRDLLKEDEAVKNIQDRVLIIHD